MFNRFSSYFVLLSILAVAVILGDPAVAEEQPTCPQSDLVNNKMMTADAAAIALHSLARDDVNTTLMTVDFKGALLDSNFLAALIREFGKPTKFSGLRVVNANFPQGVHLDFADVDIPLEVSEGCSGAAWTLEHAHFSKDLVLRYVTMTAFKGYGSHFEQVLALTQSSIKGDVDLKNAKVDKALDLTGTKAQAIFMDALQAEGNITLNSDKDHSVEADVLSVSKADVKGDIYATGSVRFGRVSFEHSNFSGSAILSSIHVTGPTTFADTRFGHDIIFGINLNTKMPLSRFDGPLDIEGAVVDGSINLNGTFLNLVDLGSSVAKRGLTLASEQNAINWQRDFKRDDCTGRAQLNLQDFEAATIQDYSIKDWPPYPLVEMDNFRFLHSRAWDGGSGGLLSRSGDIIPWLNSDCSFNPVSYERVAELLRADGHWDVANDVLTARWQADLDQESTPWLRKTLLFLAKWMIGFGVGMGYLRILVCALVLTLIGWYVITRPGAYTPVSPDVPKLGVLYSLNRLLPVISLADNNPPITLTSPLARGYFAVHTILGWIMSAFILAGLALLSR